MAQAKQSRIWEYGASFLERTDYTSHFDTNCVQYLDPKVYYFAIQSMRPGRLRRKGLPGLLYLVQVLVVHFSKPGHPFSVQEIDKIAALNFRLDNCRLCSKVPKCPFGRSLRSVLPKVSAISKPIKGIGAGLKPF